jgi:acetylornithine deacetylase/succinyl-diaminopimelate desuccinylase-like protein
MTQGAGRRRAAGIIGPMMRIAIVTLAASAVLGAQAGPNDGLARDVYKQLVEINTTESSGSVTKAAEAMAERLRTAGIPAADIHLDGPDARKHNLVARFRGTGARRPMLLLAHLDVVEAKASDWSVPPFTFLEKDGFFYGRGTSDDKAMASQIVANVIRLKQEGFKPDRDIIVALTADEEGGPANGVDWLVKNHRDWIDAELALNEGGSGQMKNGKYLINEIGASEKVYQDFTLTSKNPGGHSSRPVRDNAIYHLSDGLAKIERYDFPLHLSEITRVYFERMAVFQSDARVAGDMRAVAKVPPDAEAAKRLSAQSAYYNALMRTTCVATMLTGGHATNALPQTATANVNCRILPGEPPATIKDRLVEVLADPKVSVAFVDQAKPSEPSPLSPAIMGPVESITHALWPGVVVVPTMGTGATDGLYLRNAGIPTYGVEGLFYEVDDNRAHGRDERVGVKQYFEALEFQYRLIKALASNP